MKKAWMDAKEKLNIKNPLIHCITSPIAINDCANVVLALGAKPIMAEHPKEVEGVTKSASALGVSLANITDVRAESMMISGKAALDSGIPSVLDAVGVTCSQFRKALAEQFISECRPSVIKGNVSEIKALAGVDFSVSGIDVSENDRVSRENRAALEYMTSVVKKLAENTGSVVMATGETDIISDGKKTYYIENGSPLMARVTGTGCMLNCITAVFLSVTDAVTAAVLAAASLGISGELADSRGGLGTYHINLIDALSLLTEQQFSVRFHCHEA